MIRNCIKTAWRSLLKNKGFTFINISGLALALTACLLITFYVFDELSFDRYNIKHDRIFRVNTDLKYGANETSFAICPAPAAGVLLKEFPEVENSMRIGEAVNVRFKKGSEIIEEKGGFYCDNSIFSIFTLPMTDGNPGTALKEPNSMVISKTIALKYFNTYDAVGKTMFLVSDSSFHKVTGVMEDMPVQSHFRADFLMYLGPNTNTAWTTFSTDTYILLKNGANAKALESKFPALIRQKANSPAFNYDKFEAKGNYIKLSLTPVTDIHLHSNRQRELGPNGNAQYIYIFWAVAVFILLLACINFMNLSTARSAGRAREVGVRKVLGSTRKHLIIQFLSESVMVTLAAAIIALMATWAFLPSFNQISGKELAITVQTLKWVGPSLLAIIIVVGILAGSYPAFFLSAFRPILVLKGKLAAGFKGGGLRGFLVVFQFSISIFLIIGTIVIYNQLNFIRNKDLGFNRSQVLIIKNVNSLDNSQVFRQELKQIPGVVSTTLSVFWPTSGISFTNYVIAGGKQMEVQYWTIDADYIQTMGMKIVRGRDFSSQFASDSSATIINETMAKKISYREDFTDTIENRRVIGVVKDFNFSSLRDNVTPLMMVIKQDYMASMLVRLNTTHLPGLLEKIENTWRALAPAQHFEYSFMDDDFNALYKDESRMGQLFVIFTGLAIAIACLGLFGLAAYAAEQRTREISVRKVLGASVASIAALLTKDFLKLVILAIVIATPLAWLLMQKWLQGFAYRENIHWWVLSVAGVAAIIVTLVTVSFRSVKAATANPVDSLRSE